MNRRMLKYTDPVDGMACYVAVADVHRIDEMSSNKARSCVRGCPDRGGFSFSYAAAETAAELVALIEETWSVGSPGPQGPPGATGPSGAPGPKGDRGATGPSGSGWDGPRL